MYSKGSATVRSSINHAERKPWLRPAAPLLIALSTALAVTGFSARAARAETLSNPIAVQASELVKTGVLSTMDAVNLTSEDIESVTVDRVISFVYDNGEPAADDVLQTVLFTRAGTPDPETGEVIWEEEWTKTGSIGEYESPVIEGWNTRTPIVPADEPATPDYDPEDVTVVYTKDAIPTGSDVESFGGLNEPQKGKPEFAEGDSVIVGYAFVGEDGADTADPIVTNEGTYTIDVTTGEVTFQPKKDFEGKGTTVKVRVTDANGFTAEASYTPHVVKNVQQVTVARTINYVYENGDKALDPATQTAIFTRPGTVDAKTGKVKWVDWKPVDFAAVPSPVIAGYTAVPTTVEAVKNVRPDGQPADVTVIYVRDSTPTPDPDDTIVVTDVKPVVGVDTGSFIARTHITTYTVSQKVSADANTFTILDTLEGVMEFVTDPTAVAVSCNGVPIGATAEINGQTLSVTVPDATSLRNQTVAVVFQAKVRDGANLTPYTGGSNIASIPNTATTVFNGDANRTMTSDPTSIKVAVGGTPSARPAAITGTTTATAVRTGTPSTGDGTWLVAPALIGFVGGALALVSRKTRREF